VSESLEMLKDRTPDEKERFRKAIIKHIKRSQGEEFKIPDNTGAFPVVGINLDDRINIGDLFIANGTRPDKVWIGRQSGEGGEFDIKAFEAVIEKFFVENF